MAEYKVKISAEDIRTAVTYTSLGAKETLTRSIAQLCIEPVEIVSDETGTLPPMFRENRKLRHQFQMGILASLLGKKYNLQMVVVGGEEKAMALCMDEDEYNDWAQSHVMNQLERLKKGKDAEVANRVFDLLYDYKALELMLTGAIRDALEEHNDVLNRAMRLLTVEATQAAMSKVAEVALEQKGADGNG